MFGLEKYANIFGAPGEGAHKYKFFEGTAIIDFVLTIIGAFIISYFMAIPLSLTISGLLLLGILFHWLFGVRTATIDYIFGEQKK